MRAMHIQSVKPLVCTQAEIARATVLVCEIPLCVRCKNVVHSFLERDRQVPLAEEQTAYLITSSLCSGVNYHQCSAAVTLKSHLNC
jgi:hypothetical protein